LDFQVLVSLCCYFTLEYNYAVQRMF